MKKSTIISFVQIWLTLAMIVGIMGNSLEAIQGILALPIMIALVVILSPFTWVMMLVIYVFRASGCKKQCGCSKHED